MILGLTGAYCAGKNLVAQFLEQDGWHCIDVDKLGHEALAQSLGEVAALLDPSVINPDGGANRKAIGAAVFADPALLERYEAIVHPAMFRLCDERIDAALERGQRVCVNAMILYKMPQAMRCDVILELRAPFLSRLLRGVKRDRLPMARILDRMSRQRSILARGELYSRKIRRLANRGSPEALKKRLFSLLESFAS